MSDLSLNISKELIEPIIREKIHAAVIESFSGTTVLLDKIIGASLNVKVDRDGKISNYSGDVSFIQWFCQKAIQDSAKQALSEYINEQKPALVEAVKRQLRKNQNSVAKAFVDGMASSIESNYRMSISVGFNNKD